LASQIRPFLLAICLLIALVCRGYAQDSPDHVLIGRVSDELGGVLVGATVQVAGPAGEPLAATSTDRDGRFRVSVPAAAGFLVTVHHEAFDDAALDISAAQVARGDVLEVVLAVSRFSERVSVDGPQRDQAFAPQSPQNPYRLPLSAATISQVLTATQIQSLKPVSVFDLLNNTTGAISTSSGKKGFSGGRIRGDSNLVWIVDGAYLSSQVAGRILQSLPVSTIEQVEVIRGSSSLTLAPMVGFSNPSGSPTDGFIIIRTRRAQRSNGSVRLAFESNQTPGANAQFGTTFGRPRVSGATSLGYLSGTLSYFDTTGPGQLVNGHRYNVARHSGSGLLKAGLNQGFFNVDVTYFRDQSRFQVPNSSLVAPNGAADNWEMRPSHTDILGTAGSLAWSRRQTTLFAVSHSRAHQRLTGTGSAANLNWEDGGLRNDNRMTHLNLRHVVDAGGYRLSGGGDVMRWHTPTGQGSYEGLERHEEIKGLFGQVERSFLANRLGIDASVRRDQVHVLRGIDYFTAGAQPPRPLPLVLDRTLAPALFFTTGATARLAPRLSLLGRVGLNRQGDSNLNPVPDAILQPERQTKWELGAEGRISPYLTAIVTGFHRGVRDEKSISGYTYTRNNGTEARCSTTTVPAAGPTAPATSLEPCYRQSDTTRDGVEFVVQGGWLDRGSFRAGYTRMTRLVDTADVVQRTTPRHVMDLMLTQGWQLFSATASIKRVSLFEGRRPGGGTDTAYYPLGDYTRVDASLSRSVPVAGSVYRASIYGRNLGDVRFQNVAGYPDVGRVLGAELTVTF